MNWERLKTFYYVATSGNITRASNDLNITQSALSKQVTQLETQVKAKLFVRHHRGIVLTKQGEILFEAAKRMFAEVESSNKLLHEEKFEPKGEVKLATSLGFESLYLAPHLLPFLKKYPGIRLNITNFEKIVDLSLCDVDAAIRPYEHNDHLVQHHLLTVNFYLYASPLYIKEYGAPKNLEELKKHKLIAYSGEENHPYVDLNWHLSAGINKGVKREPYIKMKSAFGRIQLADEGVGILTLPEEHPSLKDSDLVKILPEVKGPSVELYFSYSDRLKESNRIQALKEYLTSVFSKRKL